MLSVRALVGTDGPGVLRINSDGHPGVARLDDSELRRLCTLPNHHLVAEDTNSLLVDLEMMNDEPQLLKDVIAFVAEYRNEPESRLMAETSVNDDLGVDGDDGVEFLEAFSARFAVDLSAFPYDKYFGPEASATPFSFIEAITLRLTTGRWSKLSPLKLRQLAEAVKRGSWVESPRKN